MPDQDKPTGKGDGANGARFAWLIVRPEHPERYWPKRTVRLERTVDGQRVAFDRLRVSFVRIVAIYRAVQCARVRYRCAHFPKRFTVRDGRLIRYRAVRETFEVETVVKQSHLASTRAKFLDRFRVLARPVRVGPAVPDGIGPALPECLENPERGTDQT